MQHDDLSSCIRAAQKGNNAAFLRLVKYVSPVINECLSLKIKGRDKEDLRQECLLALWVKILRDYDYRKGEFLSFTRLVLKRHLFGLMKAEQQYKRKVLNKSLSLFEQRGDGMLIKITPDPKSPDPYEVAAEQDEKSFWTNKLKNKLTTKECIVFENYIQEKSYRRIAAILGTSSKNGYFSVKSIDNALVRCRKKAQMFTTMYNVRTYH